MRRFHRAATIVAAVTLMFAFTAGAASAFQWTPQSLSFGKQKVGKKSAPKTVTVTSICGPDFDIDPGPGIVLAPGPCSTADIAISGQFAISSMTCPQTGFVGGHSTTCTIDVRFKPKAKGKQKGFLRISSSPFGGVPLDGKGCKKNKKKKGGKLSCKKG